MQSDPLASSGGAWGKSSTAGFGQSYDDQVQGQGEEYDVVDVTGDTLPSQQAGQASKKGNKFASFKGDKVQHCALAMSVTPAPEVSHAVR